MGEGGGEDEGKSFLFLMEVPNAKIDDQKYWYSCFRRYL